METIIPKVGSVLVWTTLMYSPGPELEPHITFSHWLVLQASSSVIRVVCIADDNNVEAWNNSGSWPIEIDVSTFSDDLLTNKREPGYWSFA